MLLKCLAVSIGLEIGQVADLAWAVWAMIFRNSKVRSITDGLSLVTTWAIRIKFCGHEILKNNHF